MTLATTRLLKGRKIVGMTLNTFNGSLLGPKLPAHDPIIYLEKRFDAIDRRFDDLEVKADRCFNEVMAGINSLLRIQAIEQRLSQIEKRENPQ